MYKVYLDLDHGGTDSGAVGARNVFEKDIVLSVGKKVESILKSRGIEVRISRSTDIFKSLEYRSSDANSWGLIVLLQYIVIVMKGLMIKG